MQAVSLGSEKHELKLNLCLHNTDSFVVQTPISTSFISIFNSFIVYERLKAIILLFKKHSVHVDVIEISDIRNKIITVSNVVMR